MAAALAAGLALAGCGGGADDAIEETASKLGEIRSGKLSVKVLVSPTTEDSDIGFELEGPFALSEGPDKLPQAQLRYTQIAGAERGGVEFISTAKGAWVEVDGQAYELPPDRVKGLRGGASAGGGEGEGPFGELDVASWTTDEEVSDGEPAAGQATERVRAEVDVAKALNDAIDALGELGGGDAVGALRPIEGEEAEQLEKAVKSAPLELVTGKDDRLLRRLKLDLDIGLDAPRELAGGLGELRGAKVTFDMRIEEPNGPVTVREPKEALPYTSLPQG